MDVCCWFVGSVRWGGLLLVHTVSTSSTLANVVCGGDNDDLKEENFVFIFMKSYGSREEEWKETRTVTDTKWGRAGHGYESRSI